MATGRGADDRGAAALGHASLATTNVYLRALAPADVFDAVRPLVRALIASVE